MSSSYFIKNKLAIVDGGAEVSVYSTYAAVIRLAEQTGWQVTFAAQESLLQALPIARGVSVYPLRGAQWNSLCERAELVLDFTEPGVGLLDTMMIAERVEHFHLTKMLGGASLLQKKIDFLSLHLHQPLSIESKTAACSVSAAIMTYDPVLASRLNMMGIPTVELCYRFRKHGSFLPNSLVICGDSFALLSKDDLEMIFNIYKMGQIQNLFMNKPVLEMEWDLLYYQWDQSKKSVSTKNYPVTPMETFLDTFFKCFLAKDAQGDASLDQLVYLTKKIDAIDLEETFKFIRGHLHRCLKDIEDKNFPLRGPWWSYVRPYVSFDSFQSAEISKSLRKSIIGLEMFENIYERQRKLLSMH